MAKTKSESIAATPQAAVRRIEPEGWSSVKHVRFVNPTAQRLTGSVHVGPQQPKLQIVIEPGETIEVPEQFATAISDESPDRVRTGVCPQLQRI